MTDPLLSLLFQTTQWAWSDWKRAIALYRAAGWADEEINRTRDFGPRWAEVLIEAKNIYGTRRIT